MGNGHIKVKKGTHHLFYMAIPRHTIESVGYTPNNTSPGRSLAVPHTCYHIFISKLPQLHLLHQR